MNIAAEIKDLMLSWEDICPSTEDINWCKALINIDEVNQEEENHQNIQTRVQRPTDDYQQSYDARRVMRQKE